MKLTVLDYHSPMKFEYPLKNRQLTKLTVFHREINQTIVQIRLTVCD